MVNSNRIGNGHGYAHSVGSHPAGSSAALAHNDFASHRHCERSQHQLQLRIDLYNPMMSASKLCQRDFVNCSASCANIRVGF